MRNIGIIRFVQNFNAPEWSFINMLADIHAVVFTESHVIFFIEIFV